MGEVGGGGVRAQVVMCKGGEVWSSGTREGEKEGSVARRE